jgi:hypothetical protein
MGFAPITIPPGVVKQDSDYAASGRFIDMDHVRFAGEYPEKIGGAQKLFGTQFSGIARAAQGWVSYTGVQNLVFGTACTLYVFREGTLSNITPYRLDAASIPLTNPFSTTNGSPIVTVADTAHGISAAGVIVNFSGAAAVGGITIDGDYAVTTIIGVNSYEITHSSNATSTAGPGGGAGVIARYTLNCGTTDPTYLTGWGLGGWGEGDGWGVDASLAESILSEPTNWCLDNWGEDLLVSQLNNGMWIWDVGTGVGTRPVAITNAPAQVRASFVTGERYIFALGCTTGAGPFDPMTVRWPDVDDETDWTPSSLNTAGERKLQGGTLLMAGTAMINGVSIVWSNWACFLFQFTGAASTVYASRMIASNCGLIGQHAFTSSGGKAFWMSPANFFMYSGGVQPIPKADDIRDWVYDNLDTTHASKSFAFYNAVYDEVWFVFPTHGSSEPNTYVMVRLSDFAWAHGTWTRSAATFYTSAVENRPIMFGTNGYVYVHEVKSDPNNDGAALSAHIEWGPADIQGGNTIMDVFGFVPNWQRLVGDVSVFLYGLDHPEDGVVISETIVVSPGDKLVDFKIAGRQVGGSITSNVADGTFRLGKWGLEIEGAGDKRGSQE